jgi:hypothetical protein
MRQFMALWTVTLLIGTVVSALIGCEPSPATVNSLFNTQSFQLTKSWAEETDVCCYLAYGVSASLSCVYIPKLQGLTNGRFETPQVERGTRVLGQSLLIEPWEAQ